MNAELFIPVYGSYHTGKHLHSVAEDDSIPFIEKAAIAAGYGVVSTPGVIIMSEVFGFTHGMVKASQTLARAASAVASVPAVVPATVSIVAGVVLNESVRKRIGSKHYTTPFSSGFGPVV